MRIPFFRIFYSTTYTLLFIVLLCLILLTPADALYQAYKVRDVYSIVIIAAVYVATGVCATLIYASRLYTNRSIVMSIPKPYIPVEKGDVSNNVRTLVADGLERNAIIAYHARPKKIDLEEEETLIKRASALKGGKDRIFVPNAPEDPTWGIVAHPGWNSPSSQDLPDLQYETVIIELPNLIEAKAVSLAPPNPVASQMLAFQPDTPLPPDERVVEALQRPANMGLRAYIAHLTTLGLISPPDLGTSFLHLYEQARFSSHALTEPEFRSLMGIFAEILRSMKSLDPTLVAELQQGDDAMSFSGTSLSADSVSESSVRNYGVDSVYTDANSNRRTDVSRPSGSGLGLQPSTWSVKSGETSSSSSSHGSRQRSVSVRTAPMLPTRTSSAGTVRITTRAPSLASRSAPRRAPRLQQAASIRSLRSARSMRSMRSARSAWSRSSGSDAGSVIRLAEARQPLDLPYVIRLPSRDT